jgi:predicted aminopeptidase
MNVCRNLRRIEIRTGRSVSNALLQPKVSCAGGELRRSRSETFPLRAALLRSLLALFACTALSGCYLMQAAMGQLDVSSRREPIAELLSKPTTPDTLRRRLEYVAEARRFASRELGLPDNGSYTTYADVGRQYVVWNVFATPEFSVEPRRWCFPIAGCVVYRGYFNERTAQSYALRRRMRGDDAIVGGVAAYSTLGHFEDPVLNTMLGWSDAQLAGTVFHELAHQVLYVAGDSEFNEAFASVVEDAGLERWLRFKGRSQELQSWRTQRERNVQFIELLLEARERLRTLYESPLAPAQMRERKQQEFGRLKFEYTKLKAGWNGYAGYDAWFNRALGNAHLVSAATYHGCVPGLRAVLDQMDGDLPRFYDAMRALADESKVTRRQRLCGARS